MATKKYKKPSLPIEESDNSNGAGCFTILLVAAIVFFTVGLLTDYDRFTAKMFGRESETYTVFKEFGFPYKVAKKIPGYGFRIIDGKIYKFKLGNNSVKKESIYKSSNEELQINCNSLEDKCLLIWKDNISEIYSRLNEIDRLPKSQQDSFEQIKLGIKALTCFSEIDSLESILKSKCPDEYENYKRAVLILILIQIGSQ